jgi:hypothetical protein
LAIFDSRKAKFQNFDEDDSHLDSTLPFADQWDQWNQIGNECGGDHDVFFDGIFQEQGGPRAVFFYIQQQLCSLLERVVHHEAQSRMWQIERPFHQSFVFG